MCVSRGMCAGLLVCSAKKAQDRIDSMLSRHGADRAGPPEVGRGDTAGHVSGTTAVIIALTCGNMVPRVGFEHWVVTFLQHFISVVTIGIVGSM